MAAELGLNVLLARPLISLTRAYERVRPDAPPLPFYAGYIRALDGANDTPREVATRARISKRAAVALGTAFAKSGLARQDAQARSQVALSAAEDAWRPADASRAALEPLVERFELEHPHYVMTYGSADASAVGGTYPRHGQDWKPVLRSEPLGDLPVSALLSQALMDFTIRYESGFVWALSSTVHALLKFPDEGLLLSDAPKEAGLTGNGKSGLERHLVVEVDNGGGDRKMRRATLTLRGKFARDAYEANVVRVEQEWRARCGDATVSALRAALTQVNAELEPGLADHPLLAWSGGLREAS
ncbi:MAG: hypothetical protein H0U92_02040 [Actinobacteria bacterium]|nr:hypothetical protein [Actinomycetota bacterium]